MAVFMLCIGTMWGKSVLGGSDAGRHKRQSQVVVFVSGLVALGGALLFPDALVRLSVLSYEGIAQLVPAVVGGLLWRRMTVQGALAGLIVGEAIVVPLALSGNDPLLGVNVGLIGLVANALVNVAVSRATAPRCRRRSQSAFSGSRWGRPRPLRARCSARRAGSSRPCSPASSSLDHRSWNSASARRRACAQNRSASSRAESARSGVSCAIVSA